MMTNHQHIIIIGGGQAGLEAASSIGAAGFRVTIIEKQDQTGGKLRNWNNLFPEFRPSN